MKYIGCFLLVFMNFAHGAYIPPQWRFEYNYGKTTTHYIEKQVTFAFDNVNLEQISDRHQFVYQYFLAPPWIDFSIARTITGLQVEEPEDVAEQFQYITASASFGISLPISDFWSIRLVAESFYTSMIVSGDTFGFTGLTGSQVYPEIEWIPFGSTMFIQVSPYLKVPLWSSSDVGNRKETTLGVKLKIPFGNKGEGMRFPLFAYQKAMILKLFYTEVELEFSRVGFISSEMNVRQYGMSLGFNF